MSLLLDALRRAAAANQGPAAEQETMPRRSARAADSAPDRPMSGGDDALADMDEQPLELAPREEETDVRRPPVSASADASPASPEAAGAVLDQGRTRARGRGRMVALVIAGLVLAAVALAVGGWTYYQSLQGNLSRDLAAYRPKPARPTAADVARTAGGTGEADLHSEAEAAATSADSGAGARPQSTPVNGAEPANAENSGSTAQSGPTPAPASATGHSGASTTAESGESAAARHADAKPEHSAKNAAASHTESAHTAPDETQKTQKTQATGSTASARTGTVVHERQAQPMVQAATGPSPLAEALQAGYRALRAGHLGDAETAYGRARSIAPDNRDALLGAAAVARRRGDRATARTLYARILQDHPRDPYARAGMTQINGAENPRRSETELKVLLHDHPDSAPLHFALGNVYAAESNWSDAQQAYFDAVRADSDNADYTYNLAVALDHLGETQSARRFYRKALALADRHPGGFRPAAVRRRLEQLQ